MALFELNKMVYNLINIELKIQSHAIFACFDMECFTENNILFKDFCMCIVYVGLSQFACLTERKGHFCADLSQ